MELSREREWRIKIENSTSVNSIMKIRSIFFGKYAGNFLNIILLLKKPFVCSVLCSRVNGSVHAIFVKKLFYLHLSTCYCFAEKPNEFRDNLWRRLILKYGLKFFNDFISKPPNSQLEMLFSDCSKILKDKTDVTDCAKIFVMALCKIHSQTDWEHCYLIYLLSLGIMFI